MRFNLSRLCFTLIWLIAVYPAFAQFTPADGGPKMDDGIEVLLAPYQEYELTNESTAMPAKPGPSDFKSITFVTLGKTQRGNSYGAGVMHQLTMSGKKAISMSWCLIPHPNDQGFFVLCISPKPYKKRDKIIHFAIGAHPNRMAKPGDTETFFPYTVKQQRQPRKHDLIARRKKLAAEGAFTLFGKEEESVDKRLASMTRPGAPIIPQTFKFPMKAVRHDSNQGATASDALLLAVNKGEHKTKFVYVLTITNEASKKVSFVYELRLKNKAGDTLSNVSMNEFVPLESGNDVVKTGWWVIENKHLNIGNTVEVIVRQFPYPAP